MTKCKKLELGGYYQRALERQVTAKVKAQNGMFVGYEDPYFGLDAGIRAIKAFGIGYSGSRLYHDQIMAQKYDDPEIARRASIGSSLYSAGLQAAGSLFTSFGEAADRRNENRRLARRKAAEYNRVPYYGYEYDSYADNSFGNVAYKNGGMVAPKTKKQSKKPTARDRYFANLYGRPVKWQGPS
jgi:hypothetical protein